MSLPNNLCINSSLPSSPAALDSTTTTTSFETDAFAGLFLDDGDDVTAEQTLECSHEVPRKRSKEERMQDAVDLSQREYKLAHGLTESGWYIGLDRHPSHFDRDRKVTSVNWPDIVDLRVVELNVYKLYQTRHYISSFNLGLSLLCPNDFPVRKSTLIPSDKIIPYTEALHIEWDRPSREVLDTMLRIAAKTTQVVWGVVLAEGMRKMWTQGSQGVMAQVAAECFIHASRFPDALLAISHAITDRSFLRTFQLVYLELLAEWKTKLDQSSSSSPTTTTTPPTTDKNRLAEVIERLQEVLQSCVQFTAAADLALFAAGPGSPPRESSDMDNQVTTATTTAAHTTPAKRTLSSDPPDWSLCGLVNDSEKATANAAWRRVEACFAASRHDGGQRGRRALARGHDEQEVDHGGRSVRTL